MSDEQRVRTMCGWVGMEIGKSRVRTPGRAGYGLYRVRGQRNTANGWQWSEWTAYALGLGAVESAVQAAIRNGAPSGPGSFITGAGVVPTRWTSAYPGSRTLGTGAARLSVGAGLRDATTTDACEALLVRLVDGMGDRGRFFWYDELSYVSASPAVRQRQREANAAFQEQHRERRDAGLRSRHATKLGRNTSG